MTEHINWADGCLLVYAITDRQSFNYVRRAKQVLCETPLVLVGNKADMVHLRQVSTEEGTKHLHTIQATILVEFSSNSL